MQENMLNCGDIFLNGSGGSVFVRNGKCGKQRVVHFGESFEKIANEFLAWKRSVGENIDKAAPLFVSSITGQHIAVRTLQKMFEKCKIDQLLNTKIEVPDTLVDSQASSPVIPPRQAQSSLS